LLIEHSFLFPKAAGLSKVIGTERAKWLLSPTGVVARNLAREIERRVNRVLYNDSRREQSWKT
jgi:hypothetical protein